jgi:hypothetical protein
MKTTAQNGGGKMPGVMKPNKKTDKEAGELVECLGDGPTHYFHSPDKRSIRICPDCKKKRGYGYGESFGCAIAPRIRGRRR